MPADDVPEETKETNAEHRRYMTLATWAREYRQRVRDLAIESETDAQDAITEASAAAQEVATEHGTDCRCGRLPTEASRGSTLCGRSDWLRR